MRFGWWPTAALVALGVCCAAGCARSSNDSAAADQAALGARFLLQEEPAGAVGILDYRETAAESPPAAITLVGRIGGGQPTWSSASARFLVSDPTHDVADEPAHACTSDNCPFCKGKEGGASHQAIVVLTDAAGQVPSVDARRLLPLAEGQMVVVQGRPEINALGQLVVHAHGLYVRR